MSATGSWNFRRIDSEEMRRDLNEESEFLTETIELTDTLVREVLQNSSDARRTGLPDEEPVRVSFRFGTVSDPERVTFCRNLLNEPDEHLKMAGRCPGMVAKETVPFIVVEDFGTKGLTGDWVKRDEDSFDGFFYSHGVSGKGEGNLGSRGLGKIVMTMTSRYRTKFAVSLASDRQSPWVMGMSAMPSHSNGCGEVYASHARWGIKLDKTVRTHPVSDALTVQQFCEIFSLSDRTSEPGLSVAIPFPRSEITSESIIKAVLRNHYFQILLNELVVEVGSVVIQASTFEDLAVKYVQGDLSERRLAFIYEVVGRIRDGVDPDITASKFGYVNATSFTDENREVSDKVLSEGRALHVRVPFKIRRLGEPEHQESFVDLFYRDLSDGAEAWSQYSRGGLIISDESRRFKGQALAALVAPKGSSGAASLLRDAENASHTKWNEKERVRQKWDDGWRAANGMATSLSRTWEQLQEKREMDLPDLLGEFLSIPDEGKKRTGKRGKRRKSRPVVVTRTPRPPLFSIRKVEGGFTVLPGRGAKEDSTTFPAEVRIKVAYDTVRGNPFKKWRSADFEIGKGDIVLNTHGCEVSFENNDIFAKVDTADFSLNVTGFDTNRDLQIDSRRMPG